MFEKARSPSITEPQPVNESTHQTREQLIERHLPLVTYTINRMTQFLNSGVMEHEDAFSYGVKGLISAVDNYDASRGTSFATYAVVRIRGAIFDAARTMDFLPRSQRKRSRELEQVRWALATELGRWPTMKELSERTSLPIQEVKQHLSQRGMQVQSLEQNILSRGHDYESRFEDPDESGDPAAVMDRKITCQLVRAATNSLESRDRLIVHLHYNRGLPFRIIGSKLNISESRVSQIHHRILARLRTQLTAQDAA